MWQNRKKEDERVNDEIFWKEIYDGGLNYEDENKYLESQKHKMSRILET